MAKGTNYTEKDTKKDFERFQKGEIDWNQIRGFNDEHKFWIIRNRLNSSFLVHDELMTDEILREYILSGNSNFYKCHIYGRGNDIKKADKETLKLHQRIKSLQITEKEWLSAIKKRDRKNCSTLYLDDFMMLVKNCTTLTVKLAEAIFYKAPLMIMDEEIRKTLFESDKKYDVSDYLIHQIMNRDLGLTIDNDVPISEKTWQYIANNYKKARFMEDELVVHPDRPNWVRQKEIEKCAILPRTLKEDMTADDVLFWFKIHGKRLYKDQVINYLKEFECNDWERVVTENPDIFQYLKRPKASICEAAIKARPENIQYIKNPSEKLKVLAISLDENCKQYVEITDKTCKALGIPTTEITPELYPESYYLVSFYEDLCDEGYLHYHTVIEGKNMKKFMEGTFTVSFGNLDDGERREVSECARVQSITKEEYDVLNKLGLSHCSSGYFGFHED